MKEIVTKLLLCVSTLTAVVVGLIFIGDSISFGVAVKIFIVCYIVFFVSFASLFYAERSEGN